MNRRRLFSLFPLSLMGLTTAKVVGVDPAIWVEHVCKCRIGADGGQKVEPFYPAGIPSRHEEYRIADQNMYERNLAAWNDARVCGQRFRHLLGACVKCPSCGNASYNYEAAKGIPC